MHRIVCFSACAALAALVFLPAPPARADWPSTDGPGVVVCDAASWRGYPRLLPDGCGGAYVAWLDYREGSPHRRVYAQHLCALGNPAWADDGVAMSAFDSPDAWPLLVRDGTGDGGFVVWNDFRADTAGNVYVQRVSAQQPALWGPNGLPVALGPLHERQLAAAADDAGGLFVAWADDRDGTQWQIRVQHVSATGSLLWDEAGVLAAPNPELQGDPRLARDGAGGVIVSWGDYRGLAPNLFAQRLDATGARMWATTGVALTNSAFPGYQGTLAPDGRGGAYAAFARGRAGTSWLLAAAQHIDRNGALAWDSEGVELSTLMWPMDAPQVVEDRVGGAFFTWSDYRNDGWNHVSAAHFDSAAATPQFTEVGAAIEGLHAFGHSLAADDEGGAIVAWNGEDGDGTYQGGGPYGVWAQHFDDQLTLAWTPGGVQVGRSSGWNMGVATVTDHRGGAIVGWRGDDGAITSGVFAARLDAAGQPGTAGVPPATSGARLALSAGPSPARGGAAITLRLALGAAAHVRVALFDLAGRRVATLAARSGAPGTLALPWDGRDAAGRRVPAGLYFARAEALGQVARTRLVIAD